MRFLIDSMFPPEVTQYLNAHSHDARSPVDLGAHNLPDDVLVEIAAVDRRVIVTENASDFAHVTECPVLLVRKEWWPPEALATGLAAALDRWAAANPEPGQWAHWLEAELR